VPRTAGRHQGGHGLSLLDHGDVDPSQSWPLPFPGPQPWLFILGGRGLLHPHGITDLRRSRSGLSAAGSGVVSPSRRHAGMSWEDTVPLGGGELVCVGHPRGRAARPCSGPFGSETPKRRWQLKKKILFLQMVANLGGSSKWSWKVRLIPQRFLSRSGARPAETPSPCRPSQ